MTAPLAALATEERRRSVPVAILTLVRWPNALIACVGVVLGAWWVRPQLTATRELVLAVVAACLVTAAVNALNDVYDARIDEIAHPDRPLPRGELSAVTALRIGWGACFAAIALAMTMDAVTRMLVVGAAAAGAFYAIDLNRRELLANIVVAVVASLPFVVGAATAGNARGGGALFGVAVPLHLAREVMKGVTDAPGDRGHRRTVALRWGSRVARGIALGAVLSYAVAAAVVFASSGSWRITLFPSVLVAVWATVAAPEHRAPLLLKLAMLLAMAALPFLRGAPVPLLPS